MTEVTHSKDGAETANAENLKDPNYCPPLKEAVPLGLQHVLAMFAGNVTVPIIIAGVAGLSGGDKVFLIQTAMFVAGIATLMQTIGIGPIGARLPIVQGTSFAFIPIMIPIVKTAGLGALFASAAIGGVFHFILGTFIGRIRGILPPLVTGIVV
uniref:solute carrier family 23 protein n=1 Tax=uncultured Kiloniella sp. TaxID=1133091 RepID=UPI002637740F